MDAIKDILEILGIDSVAEMDINESITVPSPHSALDDLTIEKVGEGRLSVAHYHKQRGDLMRDPEVVFNVGSDTWVPIEYIQDPLRHDHNETGLDLGGFQKTWSDNIRTQGYLTEAKELAEERETSEQ